MMPVMHETQRTERALLVLVIVEGEPQSWPVDEQKREFINLVRSTGIEVAALETVKRKTISAGRYIGTGKATELALKREEHKAGVVIFNNNLTFTQQRNLEDILGVKTIDRTQLILDIFSRHAHTQEGALQVELAQLEYLLPRLKGKGIVLSRLGGGIGTRGPGEKKLEVERRRIQDRIVRLKKDLDEVRKHRDTQRKMRLHEKISLCSLVGYTNAGKSTLLNALTGARQATQNSLFTTLDPLSRSLTLAGHLKAVISDTVGFIYKLPPHLIESFKATLEELRYADLLIHVVDASSPNHVRLIAAVDGILKELGLDEKPRILVCNKTDALDEDGLGNLKVHYPDAVFISARDGTNTDVLLDTIKQQLTRDAAQYLIRFPFGQMKVLDYLYTKAEVFKVDYTADEAIVWARIGTSLLPYLEKKGVTLKKL